MDVDSSIHKNLIHLRRILTNYFSEGELRTLCFDMGIDYDILPGDGTLNKSRELVAYLERRGRIADLIAVGKEHRPNISWEDINVISDSKDTIERLAVEMVKRREIGIYFNIYLGNECFLESGTEESKSILRLLSGEDNYGNYFEFMKGLIGKGLVNKFLNYLSKLEPPTGYFSLCRLISAGWFNLIITTNIDNFFEEVLAQRDISGLPIEKLVFGHTPFSQILSCIEASSRIRLLKIRGDLASGKFIVEENTELREGINIVLRSILMRDTVLVGHGFNDPEITQILKPKGDSLWLVNHSVTLNRNLSALLADRKSLDNIIEGRLGQFNVFFEELEKSLVRLSSPYMNVFGQDSLPDQVESIKNTDLERTTRLVRLQNELAQLQLEMQQRRNADHNQNLLKNIEMLQKISQEIDALSHAGEGTVLGGFRIGERIGWGGVGSVYRADHLMTKMQAAVKVMSRDHSHDPVWRSRFFRGAKIMAMLNHPNIVRILDVGGVTGPWCYYAMEYIEGSNLDLILASGALKLEDRWRIAQQILEAVAFAHRQEKGPIVHRDLKPSNILIDKFGNAKLTDFDIAFLEEPTVLTRTISAPLGMAFYMAPELEFRSALDDVRDPKVDVFALGRILLRLFTNLPAVERLALQYLDNEDTLRLALSNVVPGFVVNPLVHFLQKATAFEPEIRFPDAFTMLQPFNKIKEIAGWPIEKVSSRLKLDFRELPAGTFTMGSPDDEPGRELTEILHQVEVTNAFFLLTIPVTKEIWSTVWGEELSDKVQDIPVEKISWYDAIGFCNALSMYYGLDVCYIFDEDGVSWKRESNGFRLPTEAEWEYACRAGTATKYNLGNTEEDLACSGWYEGNCNEGPLSVCQKLPNLWGLYDMHGNVWEWCWDWFEPYNEEFEKDPFGPKNGTSRVLRGGSYRRSPHHCRSATRYESSPNNRGRSLGFRIARTKLADK